GGAGGVALCAGGGGEAVGAGDDAELLLALWDLVWAGRVTNDTLAPLRAMLHRRRTRRWGRPRRAPRPTRFGPPAGAGRWSLVPAPEPAAPPRPPAPAAPAPAAPRRAPP